MAENRIIANNGLSIVLYTTDDGNTRLEVKLEKDTVWLNREQIAQLYGRDYKTIAKHINNALREELEGEPVVAKFATPKKYGRKEGVVQMQDIEYYNLDMIISIGYRVKSRNGIVFRKWANTVLKQSVSLPIMSMPSIPSTVMTTSRFGLRRRPVRSRSAPPTTMS